MQTSNAKSQQQPQSAYRSIRLAFRRNPHSSGKSRHLPTLQVTERARSWRVPYFDTAALALATWSNQICNATKDATNTEVHTAVALA